MPKKTKFVKRWAICKFYEPFVLGGDVMQWRRFEVKAEDVELADDVQAFLSYEESPDRYVVYERTTGGFLGEGKTKNLAFYQANKAILETPDLKEQIKGLGDTSRFRVVEAKEALSRINKGRG